MEYRIRDPFAGEFDIEGASVEEAVAEFYRDIPGLERPVYVWHEGTRVFVPGGTCTPCQ